MNRTILYFLAFALVAAAFIYWYNAQNKLVSSLAQANRPLYLNQNFYSVTFSPSTTNIDKVEGNGHAIGNANTVQNEQA